MENLSVYKDPIDVCCNSENNMKVWEQFSGEDEKPENSGESNKHF